MLLPYRSQRNFKACGWCSLQWLDCFRDPIILLIQGLSLLKLPAQDHGQVSGKHVNTKNKRILLKVLANVFGVSIFAVSFCIILLHNSWQPKILFYFTIVYYIIYIDIHFQQLILDRASISWLYNMDWVLESKQIVFGVSIFVVSFLHNSA